MEPTESNKNAVYNGLNFSQSVEIFLNSAWWLTESDQPAVTALELCAGQLDNRIRATLMAEFTKNYRLLMNRRPSDDEPTDSLDDWLVGLNK